VCAIADGVDEGRYLEPEIGADYCEQEPEILNAEPALCDNPPRKIPYYRLRPIHFGHYAIIKYHPVVSCRVNAGKSLEKHKDGIYASLISKFVPRGV
jgi:hypothetical protein